MAANYGDIIFFAIIAVYLALKLFSVLGKKNDQDSKLESSRATLGNNILPEKDIKPAAVAISSQPEMVKRNNLESFNFANEQAKSSIKEIIEKDTSFSLEGFFEGAKIAFEMLLKAFGEKDKNTLKELLSDELYPNFEKQLVDTSSRDHVVTKSLVAFENIEIESAEISGSRVRIGLKFLTEQINYVKDVNGNIIEGDPKAIIAVEDNWQFERNIRSGNPNWTIISL